LILLSCLSGRCLPLSWFENFSVLAQDEASMNPDQRKRAADDRKARETVAVYTLRDFSVLITR
jgi:hypothetical protein